MNGSAGHGGMDQWQVGRTKRLNSDLLGSPERGLDDTPDHYEYTGIRSIAASPGRALGKLLRLPRIDSLNFALSVPYGRQL